jgi:hypothetical protein
VIAVDRSNAVDTTGDVGAVYKGLTLARHRWVSSCMRATSGLGPLRSSTPTSIWWMSCETPVSLPASPPSACTMSPVRCS